LVSAIGLFPVSKTLSERCRNGALSLRRPLTSLVQQASQLGHPTAAAHHGVMQFGAPLYALAEQQEQLAPLLISLLLQCPRLRAN
jgi:hypothetical protein